MPQNPQRNRLVQVAQAGMVGCCSIFSGFLAFVFLLVGAVLLFSLQGLDDDIANRYYHEDDNPKMSMVTGVVLLLISACLIALTVGLCVFACRKATRASNATQEGTVIQQGQPLVGKQGYAPQQAGVQQSGVQQPVYPQQQPGVQPVGIQQPVYPQQQLGYPQQQLGYPQPQLGYPQQQPGYPQPQPMYPPAQATPQFFTPSQLNPQQPPAYDPTVKCPLPSAQPYAASSGYPPQAAGCKLEPRPAPTAPGFAPDAPR